MINAISHEAALLLIKSSIKLTFREQEITPFLRFQSQVFRTMYKKLFFLLIVTSLCVRSRAQLMESFEHSGEYGFSAGVAHYFGDLNSNPYFNAPKFSGGIFFKKQFDNYVGIKVNAHYAMLGYSDKYNKNYYDKIRNLSFNTNIWELSVSGEFNFFRFQPGFNEYRFTPYVSLGVGVFNYDPYTYLYGVKYYLRPLGTEGQGSAAYPNLKPYSSMAVCFPIGLGMKYSLNERMNVFGEICYRFTTTDYIDDVSGNYAPEAFPLQPNGQPSPAFLLQDRSYEYGYQLSNVSGRQRGNSDNKDSYVTIELGLSFNLSTYLCPKH